MVAVCSLLAAAGQGCKIGPITEVPHFHGTKTVRPIAPRDMETGKSLDGLLLVQCLRHNNSWLRYMSSHGGYELVGDRTESVALLRIDSGDTLTQQRTKCESRAWLCLNAQWTYDYWLIKRGYFPEQFDDFDFSKEPASGPFKVAMTRYVPGSDSKIQTPWPGLVVHDRGLTRRTEDAFDAFVPWLDTSDPSARELLAALSEPLEGLQNRPGARIEDRYHAALLLAGIRFFQGDAPAVARLRKKALALGEAYRAELARPPKPQPRPEKKVDPKVIDALVARVTHASYMDASEAAKRLGELNARSAVPALIRALPDPHNPPENRDEVPENTRAICWALLYIGDKRAVPPLVALVLAWPDEYIEFFVEVLGGLRDSRAVSALIQLLTSQDRDIRDAAAEALGKIGDARAAEPLIELLNTDDDIYVLQATIRALARLGDRKWPVMPPIRTRWPSAVEPLIKALGHQNPIIRHLASWALGEIGDKRAVGPLIELLATETDFFRGGVLDGLAKLRDPRAIEPLIEFMARDHGPDARLYELAAEALRETTGVHLGPRAEPWRKWWQAQQPPASEPVADSQ
jgi:HEAT repeat protein